MITLFHHPFCPHSRFVRIALGEYRVAPRLVEERIWERRDEFLALNPEGTTPVLIEEGRPAVPGAATIAEYLDETRGAEHAERRLLPTDTSAIRAARHNIRYHLAYIGWLARQRTWLAGERMSYADLAAAVHLSVADYLGDVPWNEDEAAKTWYARVKSRPSFRPLLAETVPGIPPSASYADLDF